MRKVPALLLISLLIVTFTEITAPQSRPLPSSAVASMDRKLQRIETNGASAHPDQTPTEFTEEEVNSYIASGRVQLPSGVQSVKFQGEPGVVIANTRVDFDQLKSGRNSSNPLLGIFTGIHDVVVQAHAKGGGGQGVVNVDTVSLDGVEIPRFALQLFAEKYLRPKYPNIGLDSRFALPVRIDTATVGQHKLTITQK
ncbi:MAG: hypothetical protein DMG88_17245 [Acidobacteria bacterium]|nr:MAG: hypothetical protein DMG88_17245 [Acidobacteriota bacterium]